MWCGGSKPRLSAPAFGKAVGNCWVFREKALFPPMDGELRRDVVVGAASVVDTERGAMDLQ